MKKSTTQNAFLERFLANQRTKQIGNVIKDKAVLDFGCGVNLWTAQSLLESARFVHGIDSSLPDALQNHSGIQVYKTFEQIKFKEYEVITALAVFEHLGLFEFLDVLSKLNQITTPQAIIVGTIPTPISRPILEFLSYKLRLIDPSQIRDHKFYYDDLSFAEMLSHSPWKLDSYTTFQLGLNSRFLLTKRNK